MPVDRCCCCHILTNAAVVGMLQLLIIVLTMSSSGTVLDRWRLWEESYKNEQHEKHMKHMFHYMMMKNKTFMNDMKGDMDKLQDTMKMEFMAMKMKMLKKNVRNYSLDRNWD